MSEPMNQEDLKRELNIVFTATWTPELIETARGGAYEGRSDLIGKPIFYDAQGELKYEEVAQKMGVPVQTIRDSFQSWLDHGNSPPADKSGRSASAAPPIQAPQATQFDVTPVEPTGGSTMIRDATTHYQEVAMLNNARHQYQVSQNQGVPQQQGMVMQPGDSSQAMLATLMTELIRSQNGSGGKSDTDSLVLLKMMEASERNSERSRSDQAMMMNAMNQNNTQMMGLVIDSMRNGGGRSTTDETLIGFALDQMRGGGSSTPEESIVDRLISSGQLAEITGSIATGLKSVMAARQPPVGVNPGYAEPAPQPQQQVAYAQPQQQFEQPAEMPEVSFEDKCRAVMQQIHATLPDEWKANETFIEILKNGTERAVVRAEARYPVSIQHQVERAIMELLIIVNLRLIGTSVQNINQGIVSVEMAGNILGQHELYTAFANESYDSLIEIITSYIDCDPPGKKNIAYDIEFLSNPENRQVIEGVLAAASNR